MLSVETKQDNTKKNIQVHFGRTLKSNSDGGGGATPTPPGASHPSSTVRPASHSIRRCIPAQVQCMGESLFQRIVHPLALVNMYSASTHETLCYTNGRQQNACVHCRLKTQSARTWTAESRILREPGAAQWVTDRPCECKHLFCAAQIPRGLFVFGRPSGLWETKRDQ